MKRALVVITLLAFIGLVAFARLTRMNRIRNEKAPVKQEQKIDNKKEHRHHCLFS